MKISELKVGYIFKFGNKPWDEEHRFHSYSKEEDGRYIIFMIGLNYLGNVDTVKWTSFTWRDSDVEVFIPKYYLSEQKKTKGLPCKPVSNARHIYPKNLSSINLSDVYCNHNKYWYDYAEIN